MNAKMNTQLVALCLFAAGTAMARPGGNENKQPPSAADFVKTLDKDNDGKVSKSEFNGPAEHFAQFDQNSDGYISAAEAPTGPPSEQKQGQQLEQQGQGRQQQGSKSGGADFVTRLDKNNDGKVSSSEFDGPAEHFSEMDKNNDGYLSKDEAPTGPPPGGRK
ncbi:EF-hand domain-containing protein [Pontiella sulfatireligans]|uniref:EF-hand domain-containing protein n=1 Tax=Pontiella sulfatireligans TaxID=2750658 RepID=A0A6C2ULV6_9BACT|nr:EF-hand domain-containing protein [Pontiella sulfatireligans]VGO20331.1 hypothetical protein SCARR_02393 [Pontiella sulfatireligans]